MIKISQISLLIVGLCGIMLLGYADRGISKRGKTRITLNINSSKPFTSNLSFNLKTGLKYKGSLLSAPVKANNSPVFQSTVVTYQKGNTIYVIPYKQKIVVPEMRQGYTGMKLIIRSN
jgi:hypothetical protein